MTHYKLIIHREDWPFFIAALALLVLLTISILKQIY